jgi:hypothetical protein
LMGEPRVSLLLAQDLAAITTDPQQRHEQTELDGVLRAWPASTAHRASPLP